MRQIGRPGGSPIELALHIVVVTLLGLSGVLALAIAVAWLV
jgi:hypothetical protein